MNENHPYFFLYKDYYTGSIDLYRRSLRPFGVACVSISSNEFSIPPLFPLQLYLGINDLCDLCHLHAAQ